jgi:hypothetical protein
MLQTWRGHSFLRRIWSARAPAVGLLISWNEDELGFEPKPKKTLLAADERG